MNFSRSTHRF